MGTTERDREEGGMDGRPNVRRGRGVGDEAEKRGMNREDERRKGRVDQDRWTHKTASAASDAIRSRCVVPEGWMNMEKGWRTGRRRRKF
jgi:hypothetical protein